MLLKNHALRILRRLRLNHVSEPRQARDIGVLVDHLDLAFCDASDDQLVVDPNSDHRKCCHDVTLKEPADDLREAARYMRSTLCYGGSADPFYRAIAEWWEREAGQAERKVYLPGWTATGEPMSGAVDDLAVKSARAYLPGARAWLHERGSR